MTTNAEELALQLMPSMYRVDLMHFDCLNLDDAGELAVRNRFRGVVYMVMGQTIDDPTILEVSRMSIGDANDGTADEPNLYAIRNLSSSSPDAVITVDNHRDRADSAEMGIPDCFSMTQRGTTIIGRETTPELRLPDSVDYRHVYMRLGNIAGNVHFADLYSTGGTSIYLSRGGDIIANPRRTLKLIDGGIMTMAKYDGRWQRDA